MKKIPACHTLHFISFQQFFRTLGPIQTSKAGTKHFRNYTCSNACARTHTRTYRHAHTHTHKYTHTYTTMTVSAIVAGIDITQYTCSKVSYYDVHTLYIIHYTSARVNSDISQYCSQILSNECCKWPAPSFSEPTFTLDLECIAIYLILIPIGVFSKLALDTNNWIMEFLLSSHDS